jgi:hypothetical protein
MTTGKLTNPGAAIPRPSEATLLCVNPQSNALSWDHWLLVGDLLLGDQSSILDGSLVDLLGLLGLLIG